MEKQFISIYNDKIIESAFRTLLDIGDGDLPYAWITLDSPQSVNIIDLNEIISTEHLYDIEYFKDTYIIGGANGTLIYFHNNIKEMTHSGHLINESEEDITSHMIETSKYFNELF